MNKVKWIHIGNMLSETVSLNIIFNSLHVHTLTFGEKFYTKMPLYLDIFNPNLPLKIGITNSDWQRREKKYSPRKDREEELLESFHIWDNTTLECGGSQQTSYVEHLCGTLWIFLKGKIWNHSVVVLFDVAESWQELWEWENLVAWPCTNPHHDEVGSGESPWAGRWDKRWSFKSLVVSANSG